MDSIVLDDFLYLPYEIIIVDKRKNKLIKKETEWVLEAMEQ